MATGQFGISQHVTRREDARLITGGGNYADDTGMNGQAFAAFLRSPVGHADIAGINVTAAAAAPGVIAVYVGEDLQAAGVGPIPNVTPFLNRDGSPMLKTQRPAVAVGRVRHVGEIIAVVVAESTAQAQDAVDLIDLDVDTLPTVVDIRDAAAEGAMEIWDDIPGNMCLDFQIGDEDKAKAAIDNAAHVVKLTLSTNRLMAATMEPRSAVARFDTIEGRYELITGSQGVNAMRNMLADAIFQVPHEKMRVRTNDVGGGFGMKTQAYPEYVAILFAAKACGRPVKWQGSRSEAFLADNQARDGVMNGTMAFDADGKIQGFRVDMIAAMGGYLSSHGPAAATRNVCNCLTGCYDNPALEFQVRCYMTNNVPIGPYRGAGRPEAAYMLERMMDQAARELGIDRIELRRRNFIKPAQMPYTTSLAQVYDSGEFEAEMDKALALAEWDDFPARRAASEANGKLRGIGLSCFVETAGGMLEEGAKLSFSSDGTVEARLAVQSNGQGHATSFAQVVSDLLQVPYEKVRIVEGDSFETPSTGFASVASRSMALASGAISVTADAVIAKGMDLASHVLEAAVADIEYSDGEFRVTGTDRTVDIFALAAQAGSEDLPEDAPDSLDSEEDFTSPEQTYPNGCHICEVEIDPETGVIDVLNYIAVDDCGTVINPMIVHGQVHGGVAQGLGQILGEHAVYDDDGQLLAGSFMDYMMPRATDMPDMKLGFHSVPCTTNPVGAKGAGEAGTTGALAAGMNAIVDALSVRGITELDMPATPPRVWAALNRN
ncbi:MAG: xanthine dehydrogenase family protein molybdopterin-binding subunit [Rhodospirillaceae bacterium]|jgi:aerobic carbon-monoxide dehydrogenase large subunit|nr:xanthine dehydrogenase family protein molybdopterin-binding subunit [Rhodospirillaceae bacterium]MBT5943412.1 xanthine dehydrogenase family protein molybdopterin-binding subunit [Rhodospirillaceae bacterium]MBT6405517.1 xanthine dehydrogenase family protein molybdopterin-binding subunit [Rhodospirillaceae bacterium]MBT7361458.1 xanthine dehydrogenase family protein molybdopterin-binding subunit [Rhodospirillaceae bacterium]